MSKIYTCFEIKDRIGDELQKFVNSVNNDVTHSMLSATINNIFDEYIEKEFLKPETNKLFIVDINDKQEIKFLQNEIKRLVELCREAEEIDDRNNINNQIALLNLQIDALCEKNTDPSRINIDIKRKDNFRPITINEWVL